VTSQHFRIESLADHLDFVETIGSWHWDEWGHRDPIGSRELWIAGMRERANRINIPTTFVALAADSDDLLGSVTLVDNDMSSHPAWAPWIAGVYVRTDQRGQGIASALVRHAVQAAAALGVPRLYLHTETARALYESLGWQPIGEEVYEDELSTIMSIETSAPTSS
jgi:GNAT superfamily N-acetyltransferase